MVLLPLLKKHPAFWIGVLLLGFCGLGLGWSKLAIIPWIVALLFPWIFEKNWLALTGALLLGTVCYFYVLLNNPNGPQSEVKGIGYFQISEIKEEQSHFGKAFLYQGKILRFEGSSGEIFHNLPCRIYVKSEKNRQKGNSAYLIKGHLLPKKYGNYVLKSKEYWNPVKGTFSFTEWRYELKQKSKKYLESHFGHSKVTALFSALALGNIDDRQMASDFRNLGLSHLLAISGFHFALASAFITFVLKRFLPRKALCLSVFVLCSAYALFLGTSPSILRAWAAISLFLFANFFDLRTTGLNALGFGLIVEILFDPLMANQIGFGLSFLATAAILLLYSPCESLLRQFFLVRKPSEVDKFSFFEKHLYLIAGLIRKSIALNLSVHVVLLPACLLFFKTFPCLSLLYNLFFPYCIGLSLSFLFLTIPIDLAFPSLGTLLHKSNLDFAQFLLDITAYPPPFFNIRLQTSIITPLLFSLWLFSLMGIVLYFDKKRAESL
jgi:competence protein ComEC